MWKIFASYLAIAVFAVQCYEYPAPYFDEGENLSFNNCGTGRQDFVAYLRQADSRCFGLVISRSSILTRECNIRMQDGNIYVFVGGCAGDHRHKKHGCKQFKVEDYAEIKLSNGNGAIIQLFKTEEISDPINPICLYNRDRERDLESRFFEEQLSDETIILKSRQRIVPCNKKCDYAECTNFTEVYEGLDLPPQILLCVEKSYSTRGSILTDVSHGRIFLRGLLVSPQEYSFCHGIYIDVLPYTDWIAKHDDNIAVFPKIPPTKQIKLFNKDNLSFSNCGISSGEGLTSFFERVTTPGEYPWHAFIKNFATGGTCGGSLISSKAVLTAAYCVFGRNASDYEVKIATFDLTSGGDNRTQSKMPDRIIIHPNYKTNQPRHDVALMIFDDGFDMTEHVRPVCLWNEDTNILRVLESTDNRNMVVPGYGLTNGYTLPNKLQDTIHPVRTHKECYLSNRKFFGKHLMPGDNFCAGYLNGTTVCSGDSGGGLAVKKDGRWFIRGIVRYSPAVEEHADANETYCTLENYSLFSDVASHVDWIVENTPDISFANSELTHCRPDFPCLARSMSSFALSSVHTTTLLLLLSNLF